MTTGKTAASKRSARSTSEQGRRMRRRYGVPRKLIMSLTKRLLPLCLLFAGAGYGMDISTTKTNPFDGSTGNYSFLLLQGEVIPGDYDRLMNFVIRSDYALVNRIVILSSPGGDVTEALKIGRLFKQLYVRAAVGPKMGRCGSACFIIFASAVEHNSVGGLIGIHRPYISPQRMRTLSPSAAEALGTHALLDAENYLHQLRVPTNLVDAMFANASTEVYWLSDDELRYQLGTRSPWYEEFLIARCGLDKAAEDRLVQHPTSEDNQGTSALFNQIANVAACANHLTRAEAVKNFSKALAPYMHGFNDFGYYDLPPPASPEAIAEANAIVRQGQITVERHGRRYTGPWGIRGHQVIVDYGISEGQLDIGQGGASPEALATKLLNELIDKQEAFERSILTR